MSSISQFKVNTTKLSSHQGLCGSLLKLSGGRYLGRPGLVQRQNSCHDSQRFTVREKAQTVKDIHSKETDVNSLYARFLSRFTPLEGMMRVISQCRMEEIDNNQDRNQIKLHLETCGDDIALQKTKLVCKMWILAGREKVYFAARAVSLMTAQNNNTTPCVWATCMEWNLANYIRYFHFCSCRRKRKIKKKIKTLLILGIVVPLFVCLHCF